MKLGITLLIHNKDDIEFVTEFFGTPCTSFRFTDHMYCHHLIILESINFTDHLSCDLSFRQNFAKIVFRITQIFSRKLILRRESKNCRLFYFCLWNFRFFYERNAKKYFAKRFPLFVGNPEPQERFTDGQNFKQIVKITIF